MTAENMESGPAAALLGSSRMRGKRDLSYGELRNLLEAENAEPYYDNDDVLEDTIKRSAVYPSRSFVRESEEAEEEAEPEEESERIEEEQQEEEALQASTRAREEERIEEALIRYELLKNLRKVCLAGFLSN